MRQPVIIGLMILILAMPLSGCTQNNDTTSNSKDEIEVPTWNIGDYWLYTFSTPDYNDDTARLVVASH
jgi:PBP1b-binding outer membrane lipoprotein LpoB